MKVGLFLICIVFCLAQASANPKPGLLSNAQKFFGITTMNYTDMATVMTNKLKENSTCIMSTLIESLKGNSTKFLNSFPTSFDQFCNASKQVLDGNQTNELVNGILGKFQIPQDIPELCMKLSSGAIHMANEKVCNGAPTFNDVALRTQQMAEEYTNNTMRSWICTFNNYFNNQLLQSVDMTGLSKALLNSTLKEQMIGKVANVNRCMTEFITNMNITQNSTEDCRSAIGDLINSIKGSSTLSKRTGNGDSDILSAMMIHLEQMKSTAENVWKARDEILNNTQNTTTAASTNLIDRVLNSIGGKGIELPDFFKSGIDKLPTVLGQCVRCISAELVKMANDLIKFARIKFDLKRAAFCKGVQFAEKIQNMTCNAFNATNNVVNGTSSKISSQIDIFNKNLLCLEDGVFGQFSSFVLRPILTTFAQGMATVSNGISAVTNLVDTISASTAITSASSLTQVMSNFNTSCVQGDQFVDPLANELMAKLNECQMNTQYVKDLCKDGFKFSIWNPLTSIQNYWSICTQMADQLGAATKEFNRCVHEKYQNAGSTLDQIMKLC